MSRQSYRSLFNDMKREWKWIIKKTRRYWWCVLLYTLLGVIGTCMGLAVTVFSKRLIDDVVGHSSSTILVSALCVVGLALGQIIFKALSSWLTAVISTKTNNEMRAEIYSKLLNGHWDEITDYHSGDLINRLEGDAATVSNGMISFIPNLLTRFIQFFGALCIVLYYDSTMALLALLSAPILVLSSRYMVKTMRKFNSESRELNGRILSYSEESLQNIHVVKAFDLTKQYIKNFSDLLSDYRNVRLKYEKFSVIVTLTLSAVGLIVSYCCYGWGVWRLWQGAITFGTMTLFLQLSGTLSSSFSSLVSLVPSAVTIATSAGRIMEISEKETEDDKEESTALQMLSDSRESGISVCAKNITFKYRNAQEPVLNDISFSAEPGETIAFIGPSGEGKTTVLRLLLGLLIPNSGELIYTCKNNKLKVSDSTRRFCSYVPQKAGIFSGTISENLRIVNPDATDGELKEALRKADLLDFISELPYGIDSLVGENGVNLSEGQAQRIAIARAVLRNSPVLIMDEATSALDGDTESRVIKNIISQKNGRICIITTHRPSMLKYCDRVYKIASDGSLYNVTEEIK